MAIDTAAEPVRPPLLYGHPRGLAFLAGTEFWDRVSFHGMQSLLTLYLVQQLLLPGHVEQVVGFPAFRAAIEGVTGPLTTLALATQIFGIYVAAATFAPLIGAAIGDAVLGRTRSVALGAILMTIGHVCMAFDQSFLLAMLLLVTGTGFLRGNLAPQVGDLYDRDDHRRTVAFQIYGAGVNAGAFLAPLITGSLAKAYDWHTGFGFAAIGMAIGLVTYLVGQRDLPVKPRPRREKVAGPPLDRADWSRIGLLALMTPICASFWVAQSQIWNTYNLWVTDHLQLDVFGFEVPVPWLQSIDGLAPLATLPLMLVFWRWQAARGREPDEFGKMATGCFVFAVSTLWLAAGQFVTDPSGRTPMIWAVVFHLASNVGWLYFAPTANSTFNRGAPVRVTATLMGLYSVSVSIGSLVSGRMGGLYEHLSPAAFWALHAAVCGAGGLVMLLYGAAFRRRLFGPSA